MSKQIKQMEMDALRQTFQGIQDLVLLSSSGLNAQVDNQLRLGLRKKNIRLQVVKNSLARKVFDELGFKVKAPWEGPTTVAWGGDSLAQLSRELDTVIKKNKQIKVKLAVAEGQEITFDQALKMPTRMEAIGLLLATILSPGSQIASQLIGPASQVASQIKTLSEKKEETPAPAETEAPAAPPA